MKKYIFFTIIALVGLVISSCGDAEKKAKQEYIEACADGDFDKARGIIEKLQSKGIDIDEHIKYVNDKEIYNLLAHPSSESNGRILYLYNSYTKYQLPDMNDVMEVAISQDNENLAIKLINSGLVIETNVAEIAASNDMSNLIEVIIKKQPNIVLNKVVADYYMNTFGKEELNQKLHSIWNSTSSNDSFEETINEGEMIRINTMPLHTRIVEVAEMCKIDGFKELAAKEEVEKKEKKAKAVKENLDNQLQELNSMSLPPRPALGIVKSDHYGYFPEKDYTPYNSAVSRLNSACKSLISKAMEAGYPNIAKKALAAMKPTLEWNELGDWAKVVEHEKDVSSVYNAFKVTESREEINQAKTLIH